MGAPNRLIFYEFVSCNIRTVLDRSFLVAAAGRATLEETFVRIHVFLAKYILIALFLGSFEAFLGSFGFL